MSCFGDGCLLGCGAIYSAPKATRLDADLALTANRILILAGSYYVLDHTEQSSTSRDIRSTYLIPSFAAFLTQTHVN